MYRTLLANSRMPHALSGDLHAQVAAAKVGLDGYYKLIDRYGLETVRVSVNQMLDRGDAVMRRFFETVPDGRYVAYGSMARAGFEADRVRLIFRRYLALSCVAKLRTDLEQCGVRSKQRVLPTGKVLGGRSFGRGALYHLLQNRIYLGEVVHKGISYPGEQTAIAKFARGHWPDGPAG